MKHEYCINKNTMPGPVYIPWLGWRLCGLSMLKDPMKYFMDTYNKYGQISTWNTKISKHICAFGPDLYREIITQPDIFTVDAFREGKLPRGSAMERLSFGLMRLNGDIHRRHRSLMQPAFRSEIVNSYRDDIIRLTDIELNSWQIGEQRYIDHDLMRLITFISMKTMFGLEPEEKGKELQQLMKMLMRYAASPAALLFRFNIPNTPYYKMLKISNAIEQKVRGIIKDKKDSNKIRNDVLSILIRSTDDNNIGLTDDELISEAYTVLCHESSAAAISWCLFLLDQHPEIYDALYDEITTQLKGSHPTVEQLTKLTLLDHVLKETIRLLPPASFALRYTSQPCELGGYALPKDSMIFISPYVSHRIPEVFKEPLKFNPHRWETIKPTPYEYISFGAGAHSCMGRHFAILEMKIILCMIIQRFRLSLISGSTIDRGMRISFVPKQGLHMRIYKPTERIGKPIVKGNILESVSI